MRTKAGFTLVELLVVMAIIAILASIAIPNIVNYINQGQATRAIADIGGIETALTEVLADAGRSKLEQLFDADEVSTFMRSRPGIADWPPVTNFEFAKATEIYTRCLYAILRSGRNVLGSSDPGGFGYSDLLQDDVVRKLGTGYIDIANDPWGNLYNIYPGPWNARTAAGTRASIPFRIFSKTEDEQQLPGANNLQMDELVAQAYDIPGDLSSTVFEISFPAPSNEVAFIWSNGQNLLSSQTVYNGAGYGVVAIEDRARTLFDQAQGEEFAGGGDDINSWDSAASWSRFY
jgi:prepilin-type N-terminal cleavage/methylation domain-containing protein